MKLLTTLLGILGAVSTALATPDVAPATGGARWGGNYFPNVELTTHEGEKVRFYDDLIKDKVVVINFIYTHCPDVCPLETAQLTEVQAILGDRVGTDVFFYSVTIDPARDTPAVLKQYADQYQVGPGWLFLTGDEQDIIQLRKKLGLYIAEIQGVREDGTQDHNISMIIGNQKTGRWMKRSPFENPYVLADHIGSWLHNWKTPSRPDADYADAPELRDIGQGENLFRTRCAVCHVIGTGVNVAAGPRVGPDLLGVTDRRERAWLARWLYEPDKMLAEKDPLAMELYERHNKLMMPNMGLTAQDVQDLLEYLEVESRRVFRVLQNTEAGVAQLKADEEPPSCCQKANETVVATEELVLPMDGDDEDTLAATTVNAGPSGSLRQVAGALMLVVGGLGCVLAALLAIQNRMLARSESEDAIAKA